MYVMLCSMWCYVDDLYVIDQKCAYCCYLPRLCHKYYGVHPAKRFHDIYGDHIALKVGNPDITFLEVTVILRFSVVTVIYTAKNYGIC